MKKATKFLYLIPAVLLFGAPVSQANESYQATVNGIYTNTDNDDDVEITILALGGQYYFKPVSVANGPYGEAGFLNRQSSVIGAIGTVDVDIFTETLSGTSFILGFEYADPSQPITAGIIYNYASADKTISGINVELTLDSVLVQLGYHITRNSRVTFEVSQSDTEIKVEGPTPDQKGESDSYGLSYKNVMELGGDQFFNVEAGITMTENDENDKNNEIAVLGDYYFNRGASVRAGYAINSGDDIFEEGNTLLIGANFFLQQNVSVGLEIEKFSADENNNDVILGLGGT